MKPYRLIFIFLVLGLGGYTLVVSKATSYLSDDPKVCVNCHIMAPQYATWNHSSHKNVTTCNDCHVPQNNIFNSYYFKAKDGMRHSVMFTLEMEPQVIRIHTEGKEVVQENCKRCHSRVKENIKTLNVGYVEATHGEGKYCWECHIEVPHGRVNSLSSVRNTRGHFNIEDKSSVIPEWMKKDLKNKKTIKKQ